MGTHHPRGHDHPTLGLRPSALGVRDPNPTPNTERPRPNAERLTPPDGDHPHDECGVFGIFAPREDVARITYFGLFTLQHRGQESAGIAVADGEEIRWHKDMGLVSQVFDEADLSRLHGFAAIGHTRYSTTGSSTLCNAQP